MRKKVLLIVIDALATRIVRPALEKDQLPHLKRLTEAGQMVGDCVPIFPSITPAATCAIATGDYPDQTGIAGAYFYDTQDDRVFYYGDDFWIVLREGIGVYFDDFLKKLNFDLLDCDTIYERVERAGLRAACLNFLWFRGDVEHEVNVPWVLSWIPGVPVSETIRGPSILCLGDFVTTSMNRMEEGLTSVGGPFHRFGFDDKSTAGYLLELAEKSRLPDFTLAYFPDNDFRSHEVGPQNALETLQEFDETLGKLFEHLGGFDKMLDEFAIVITGDHSQNDLLPDPKQRSVNLDEALHDFKLVAAGEKWDNHDELMVCANMRAAQIYLRSGYWRHLEKIVRQLLDEERIDQVIWREELHDNPRTHYHVATRDRGELRFWTSSENDKGTPDIYGGYWNWEGDLSAVDGQLRDGKLVFPEYPNAFERIATSFRHDVSGDLWVTARPGYELHTPETDIHPAGSHGSLHREDSEVPLILAGIPEDIDIPAQPRTVDVAPLCELLLGLKPHRVPGASHMPSAAPVR